MADGKRVDELAQVARSPVDRSRLGEYYSFSMALAAEAAELAETQFGTAVARRKADGSLVTRTDELLDRLIADGIRNRYPADTILSEEQATHYDPAVERTWVVDPIDGTTNFANGFAIWGVSIALVQAGMPVVGVVAFPHVCETFSAVLGQGAWRNGEAIRTASGEPVDDAHNFMECTRTRRLYRFKLPLKSRMLGSAAYHICKVADGSALAGSEATPKVWDIAAASLILREAGGAMRTHQGDAVFPLEARRRDYGHHVWSILYAAEQSLLDVIERGLVPYSSKPRRPSPAKTP